MTEETQTQTWDYAQVTFQIVYTDMGKQLVQFTAPAECPNGDYVAGTAGGFPLPEGADPETFVPDAESSRQQNALTIFVNSLQNAGWTALPKEDFPELAWYERRLKRVTREVVVPRVKRSHKLLIGLAGLVLLIIFGFILRTWLRPFPNGINKYKEDSLEVAEVEGGTPYRRGKMLIVDPYPVGITSSLYGRPDPMHERLPDDIRADRDDEVETVVWVGCRTRVRNAWTRRDCDVFVIDYVTKEMISQQHFEGARYTTPVPAKVRNQIRDEEAIFEYIMNIPPYAGE